MPEERIDKKVELMSSFTVLSSIQMFLCIKHIIIQNYEYGVIKENEYVDQNDVLIGQYSEGFDGLGY